jgi:hypothetical protein
VIAAKTRNALVYGFIRRGRITVWKMFFSFLNESTQVMSDNKGIMIKKRTNVEEKRGSIDTANTARRGQSQQNK